MVDRLGIERRAGGRVRTPNGNFPIHPTVSIGGQPLITLDLSIGGCCVRDGKGLLGPGAGYERSLTLTWPDGPVEVRARIVARSSDRRHIQFLDLPTARSEQIKLLVAPGMRGQALRVLAPAGSESPMIQAKEVWNSLQGDNVIIEDHVHHLAHVGIFGTSYTIFRNAWPVRDGLVELTAAEVVMLLLFLYNIPNPSSHLTSLIEYIGNLSLKGAK